MCGCEPDVPSEVLPTYPFDDPDVENPLPDTETIFLPLCLTRPQFQAVLDALTYARGLLSENGCYDEYTAVDLLLGHLPFANKPLEVPCMPACDIVAECIESNPGTREAIGTFITEFVINDPSFAETLAERVAAAARTGMELVDGGFETNLEPDSTSDECNRDELFGAAVGIVDYFNAAIVDVFEKYESASNAIEAAAIAAGLAPGVGSTVENSIEIADQIQEAVAEAYAGEYDVEFRDGLSCDIFCTATAADCHITLELINSILLTRLGTVDFEDLAAVIAFVTSGALTGDQIPEAAFLLVVNALRFGSRFAGILGLTPIAAIAKRAAEEDPSSAWMDLCGECAEVEPIISLRESFPGSIINNPRFLSNTATGSIWEADYDPSAGVALTPHIGGTDVCCVLIQAAPVDQYQHLTCALAIVGPAAGDGAGLFDYAALGFIKSPSSGVVTIEIEPV